MRADRIGRTGAALLAAWLMAPVAALAQAAMPGDASAARAAREAARRRIEIARLPTLRASAEASGGEYVSSMESVCRWGEATMLEDLVSHSAVVIVGVVLQRQAVLSPDGRTISTVHAVEVAESIKGALTRGAVIMVTTPGGRLEFDGGLAAEIEVPWGGPIDATLPHLFFLRPTGTESWRHPLEHQGFAPALHPQGVFRFGSHGVESTAGPTDPLRRYVDGVLAPVFLASVRAAAAADGGRR